MICLKHRLTIAEVKKLVARPEFIRERPDTGECDLEFQFQFGSDGRMIFYFDKAGNLTEVSYMCLQYHLPPMKFITPDAPIEPPPLPYSTDPRSKLTRKVASERSLPADFVVPVPEFRSLAYANAKVAVDTAVVAVGWGGCRVLPEFSQKVLEQLKSEKLSNDKKALAIYMLSKVTPRDTNSIRAAIDQVDLRVNVPYSDHDWRFLYPWSLYPARDALLRIGESSVEPIVQDLRGETNALRRQLLCAVVSTFGRTNWTTAWQPKAAIAQLQRLRATEAEPARQNNIDAALGLLIDNKVDVNIGWSGYFGE